MTSTMSAAQLFVVAIVAVLGMSVWLALVFMADRRPSVRHPGPGPSAPAAADAGQHGKPAVPAPRPSAGPGGPGALPAEDAPGDKVLHAAGSPER